MNVTNTRIETLLTRRQAAEMLGVLPATLAIWSHYKRGPAYHKVGRNVRYKLTDLEAFIEQGRRATSEQN